MRIFANITTNQVRDCLLGRGYDDNVGMLVTPLLKVDMPGMIKLGVPWAADNGAFSGFCPAKFRQFVARIKGYPRCEFLVCPDVVGNARATIDLFNEWEEELLCSGYPIAFVLQDGQEKYPLPTADAYFVGGSTGFKLSAAADSLIAEGQRRGAWIHMGRVNTIRRLKHAHKRHIDSVDGTCMRFAGINAIKNLCEHAAMLDMSKRVRDRYNVSKTPEGQEPR